MPSQFLSQADRNRLAGYPKDAIQSDLDAYFRLTDADLKMLRSLRSDANRLGFAMQLCSLRYLGFFPNTLVAPEAYKSFIAAQLNINLSEFERYGQRDRTIRAHQQQIMDLLKYRRASSKDLKDLESWLEYRALEHDDSKLLFEMACSYLKHQKILRIGLTRIEKLIGAAKQKAEEITHQRLLPLLTDEKKEILDSLLEASDSPRTQLFWLQQTPKSNKTSAIATTLVNFAQPLEKVH